MNFASSFVVFLLTLGFLAGLILGIRYVLSQKVSYLSLKILTTWKARVRVDCYLPEEN